MQHVLSIDPALRTTGYGVLAFDDKKTLCLQYGCIRNNAKLLPSACLAAIYERVDALLEEFRPEALAVEGIIYVQSHRTAISLGAARAAAILAAARRSIPVYEYAPRKVKQSVVGHGAAQKKQVAFMIRAMLGLTETPSPDAADAIAIGMAHIQAMQAAEALKKAPARL